MGRPPRERRAPYDIEMVTAAAVRVFNRRGYEASSMQDVARETGLSKSSLYYHVSGKEELLERALERAFSQLFGVLDEADAKSGGALGRLCYIVRRIVEITLEFAPEVELMQRIKGNTPSEIAALERRRDFDRRVSALVADAAAAGELRGDIEPGLLTRLVFGMSNSITSWYRPDGPRPAAEIASAVSILIFEGIARGKQK